MRRFILGLVVVLFAAGQAWAEISTGPYGSLVMVDSTGKIVGGVADVGAHSKSDQNWIRF